MDRLMFSDMEKHKVLRSYNNQMRSLYTNTPSGIQYFKKSILSKESDFGHLLSGTYLWETIWFIRIFKTDYFDERIKLKIIKLILQLPLENKYLKRKIFYQSPFEINLRQDKYFVILLLFICISLFLRCFKLVYGLVR